MHGILFHLCHHLKKIEFLDEWGFEIMHQTNLYPTSKLFRELIYHPFLLV